LPAFVTPVLLFVNADPEEISHACAQVPGAWLQFHGDETPEECQQIANALGKRWMRAARIPLETPAGQPPFDLLKYAHDYLNAHALLLDAHVEGYGGGGKTFNWSQLPQNVNAHLVLSGGLNAANVTEGLSALRGRGLSLAVDVSSGVESAKGIKDADKILAFVNAVRLADVG
jgi:phosphoribosylanthranilate isomerase